MFVVVFRVIVVACQSYIDRYGWTRQKREMASNKVDVIDL
jgi:hypothetical protein